jgi:DNA-binding LacI/PurR family transcriptional regulator
MVKDDRRRPPTLDEVAARAGVSRTAASRVINDAPHVTPAKRQAVQRAIAELGYVPNRTARALVTQRAGAVVLAISLSDPAIFADPFFAQIMVGVTSGLDETDLHLVLSLAASPRGEARLRSLLDTRSVDGVLALSVSGAQDPLPRLLERSGLPVVYGGRPAHHRPRWFVDVDNYTGARTAVEHLIGRGCSRIVTITGPEDLQVSQERARGYREGLAMAGLAPYGRHAAEFSRTSGAAAMRALLQRHPDLDGVFAASDNIAAGALQQLREAGRFVPDDVAVVGFDDLAVATVSEPPLTTIRQPIDDIGREMSRMLLAVIDGRRPSPIILPTELVIRKSA